MSTEDTSDFVALDAVDTESEFTDLTEIPSGGYNRLLKARRFGRWWMLKGLKKEYRDQLVYQTALKKEFDLLVSMQHGGIVTVSDFVEVDGIGKCIVMEWIDGTTLKTWLAKKHSKGERYRIAMLLLDAMEYVHSRQIVHRDLKPSNIMVTRNGQNIKIIDFGLSDADSYAILKQPAGTEGYLSPEQQQGWQTDVRNDIYSIGCVLRDLQLGKRYNSVIRRCTAPAEKRYGSIAEVRSAIQKCRQLPRWIAAVILLLIVAITLFAVVSQQQTHRQEIAQTADTLSRQITAVQQANQEVQETNTKKKDSMQIGIKSLQKERDSQKLQKQKVSEYISQGKHQLDKIVKQSGIQAHHDTLSSLLYYDAKMNTAMQDIINFPNTYTQTAPSDFSEEERSTVLNELSVYVSKYVNRWLARQKELQKALEN